jgi:hypothetical protein
LCGSPANGLRGANAGSHSAIRTRLFHKVPFSFPAEGVIFQSPDVKNILRREGRLEKGGLTALRKNL